MIADLHSIGNSIEAGLWFVVAIGLMVWGWWRRGVRRWSWMAALVFLLFGASDLVEIETGAWWRPWWLLVWKAICVLALGVLFAKRVRGGGDKGRVAD